MKLAQLALLAPLLFGPEIGPNDFRISDMGSGGPFGRAEDPAVAYNGTDGLYLVVWQGEDSGSGEREVYGQLLDATGGEVGTNDFRISDMGPDGDDDFAAREVAVAYNATDNEFLVVWSGEDQGVSESEIYGQRIDGATGAELGANDFRISDMGPEGSIFFDAFHPAVAHNPAANEYVVVWSGDDNTAPLADEEFEIFGQRIDGATGAEVGTNDFRISDMGPDTGGGFFDANEPHVTYNALDDEYFVVWRGSDDVGPLVGGEIEIFGQRLDGATAADVGTNDFRISDMGPDGVPGFDAFDPVAAYNPTDGEYLVVWWAEDDTPPHVFAEHEIYGQRIDASTGSEVGANDFLISDMGPDGDTGFIAKDPGVAYSSAAGAYLVVWSGDDDTAPLVNGEFEIFAQVLDGPTGAELGPNDFALSDMGPAGVTFFGGFCPDVAYNPTDDELLVVWYGDDDVGGLGNNEFEAFGQRLLLCSSAGASAEVARLGSPPNPSALLPGLTSGPVIGSTWDPVVDHSTFLPGATFDFLGITATAVNLDLSPLGTLLCDPALIVTIETVAAGTPFAVPVPPDCIFVGVGVCTQGASVDALGTIRLTNALDVTIGSF